MLLKTRTALQEMIEEQTTDAPNFVIEISAASYTHRIHKGVLIAKLTIVCEKEFAGITFSNPCVYQELTHVRSLM